MFQGRVSPLLTASPCWATPSCVSWPSPRTGSTCTAWRTRWRWHVGRAGQHVTRVSCRRATAGCSRACRTPTRCSSTSSPTSSEMASLPASCGTWPRPSPRCGHRVGKYLIWQKIFQILEEPEADLTGRAAVYGMAQSIPDKSLVEELCTGFLDVIYSTNWFNSQCAFFHRYLLSEVICTKSTRWWDPSWHQYPNPYSVLPWRLRAYTTSVAMTVFRLACSV